MTPEFIEWLQKNISPAMVSGVINGIVGLFLAVATIVSVIRGSAKAKAESMAILWKRMDDLEKKNEALDIKNDELDTKLDMEIRWRGWLYRRIAVLEDVLRKHSIPIPVNEETLPLPDTRTTTTEYAAMLEETLLQHGIALPGKPAPHPQQVPAANDKRRGLWLMP